MITQPSLELFAGPPQGLSRAGDPATSHQAAQGQRGGLSAPILAVFEAYGNMTDDELAANLPQYHAPSVKTCRSRLSKAGRLVDTGKTRMSLRGSPMVVWRLA